MAIEKQNQTSPVVDDESPVPSQVPTKGPDDETSEGTERAPPASVAMSLSATIVIQGAP